MRLRSYILLIILMLIICSPAWTQVEKEDEPEYHNFVQSFKKSYFNLSMLLQVVGNFQKNRDFEQKNGFSIATMRFLVKGKFDKGFSYFFQTNHANAFSILDAYFSYQAYTFLIFDMGLMKAPFSKELLVYAADIDFVNRARIVQLLAPKREIGVQAQGMVVNNLLKYSLGMFNGNGFNGNANDNNRFLYSARLVINPNIFPRAGDKLEIGTSMAWSEDKNLSFTGLPNGPAFDGKRNLYEADFRMEFNKILFAGEFIYGKFVGWFGEERDQRSYQGYHMTIGYWVLKKVQLLTRLDNIKGKSISKNNQLLLGSNLVPSSVASFQINYILNLDQGNSKYNQLLINTQFSI